MQLQIKAVVLVMLLQCSKCVVSERTRDKMYEAINGASCFRRLNGTHQTGCSSTHSGSVGVLHLVQREEDFDFLLTNPPSPPYAPIIPPELFTQRNMLRLQKEGGKNISVVLLINHTQKMLQFSHELNCPNQYSGIMFPNSSVTPTCDAAPELSWNPWGTGLLHEDFPFPIFYLADIDEITKIVNCFEKFNNFNYEGHSKRSLCAVEVKTFMTAAVSSEVCMRRSNFINTMGSIKYCDPLEGRNVYATLFPRVMSAENEVVAERKVNTSEKFILVSCRLDTTSMFDGVGLGALDSLTGYATLINVAHMLAQLLPNNSEVLNKTLNVLFVVFNGESYDYIGSQRFVYDLENMAFPTRSTQTTPIGLENIEYVLDIGTLDDITKIRLHSLDEFSQASQLLAKFQHYGLSPILKFNISFMNNVGMRMPPTSAQSFLRKNIKFPAFVLNARPQNRYYHSIYDDMDNMNFTYGNTTLNFTGLKDVAEHFVFAPDSIQMKIRNISTVIALSLYETLTGVSYKKTEVANPLLTDEFLYCFLQSADCPLFKAASHPNSLPGLPIPPSRYVSVGGGSQESSGWTNRVLGYLLSHQTNIAKANCSNLPLHWFAGYRSKGECRVTTQNYSYALSPAFLIDNYDWKSGQYSTWTESTWTQFSARIFLRPSNIHEIITLSIGVVVLIISFCLVYIISSRADILFEDAPSSTAALAEPTAC
ncbi:nicastrin [Teleopsis dalmanni]|uniref:nicastrin n=1 Tax=Teleopsis dalmanni TaxID=139649 RepID=UPI0018CD4854|nr:nicastrin [Teleopsis dalmanni]